MFFSHNVKIEAVGSFRRADYIHKTTVTSVKISNLIGIHVL